MSKYKYTITVERMDDKTVKYLINDSKGWVFDYGYAIEGNESQLYKSICGLLTSIEQQEVN